MNDDNDELHDCVHEIHNNNFESKKINTTFRHVKTGIQEWDVGATSYKSS